MKNLKKAIALCLALVLCLTVPVGVSAATVDDATIDTSHTGSITIYKYDVTNSEKDGVWDGQLRFLRLHFAHYLSGNHGLRQFSDLW